jgi:hypothetical protein
MAFLVALSALFTSVQPIVDRFSKIGGWVLTGLGIVAALVSIFSVLLGYALENFEANSAKLRLKNSSNIVYTNQL